MGNVDDLDSVLATLPNGARVLSTLLADQAPPGHVYRVVNKTGTILREFPTLIELNTFLDRYPAGFRTDRAVKQASPSDATTANRKDHDRPAV